ncbi:hypothetical protein [Bacillus sp. AFS098217]|uniref:hypothetical protein n=1 Tax=Bacillus sp. AFS098217 TaxID=2033868 RepID=UPI0015CF363D|nr:hypothetical protein [Bacillus sp. AFS098217]
MFSNLFKRESKEETIGEVPTSKTKCHYVEAIDGESYLMTHDPSEDMSYPVDADHI